MQNINWPDVFARAGKTFVQAFLSAVPPTAVLAGDKALIVSSIIGAGAAGLSVIWNALLQWSK